MNPILAAAILLALMGSGAYFGGNAPADPPYRSEVVQGP